jgi:hypothetical protein
LVLGDTSQSVEQHLPFLLDGQDVDWIDHGTLPVPGLWASLAASSICPLPDDLGAP